MKIEFHVHTEASPCSDLTYQKLIKKIQNARIDAVVVCDHNTISGAQILKKIAPFKIIVGEEIETREGEIIGLFLRKKIKKNLSSKETIRQIKAQGGLVCLPHPFDRLRRKRLKFWAIKKYQTDFDLIEIFNSRILLPFDNQKAKIWAQKHHKMPIVGSDAHSLGEVGKTYFKMKDFDNPKQFLDNLKSARFHLKRVNPTGYHLRTVLTKIKNRFNSLKL